MLDSIAEGEVVSTPEVPQPDIDRDLQEEHLSLGENDLHIERGLWEVLCSRVKLMAHEKGEFLVFLLAQEGQAAASKAVSVGISHRSAVVWSSVDAIRALTEDIGSGYRIVGALHNHPDVASYIAAGHPAHYTSGPSTSDLFPAEIARVREFFDHAPWPRTIMCFDMEADVVYANTYVQNRPLTSEEDDRASFDDPLFVEKKSDNPRIRFHTPQFLNPETLVRNGIISLGDVQVHSSNETSVVTNPLKSIVDGHEAK